MPTPPNHAAWIYYRVYVDAGFEAIEYLIADVVPSIIEDAAIDRWFFLRFLDEDGLHLRLRVRTRGDVADLAARIEPALVAGAAAAERARPGAYRPTILPPPELATPYLRSRRAPGDRVVRTAYEPEVDRFGTRGVDTAERLFEASSRAALAVLADERRGGRGRKALAPALMHEVYRGFDTGVDAPSFWNDYAAYWLDPVPGLLARWRPRFVAKADELVARGATVRAATASPIATAWRRALDEAAAGFARADERRPRDLAFHLVHVMNNRLGLMPIEEAYFATLLAEQPVEEAA